MRSVRRVFLLLALVLLAFGVLFLRNALAIVTGYSAKQLCSGVFVAGLPADFMQERDIEPRMALLGPALPLLQLAVDEAAGTAVASLLGSESRAVHRRRFGCALHSGEAGEPELAPVSRDAADAGVPESLKAAFDEAFREPAGGGRNTLALLVWHDGKLVAERYTAPVSSQTRMQGWSMNKSLMATWSGLAYQQGLFDPELPLVTALAESHGDLSMDPGLSTLHLLQMESGLGFVELYGPGGDATRMLYQTDAMWRFVAEQDQAYAPGSRFAYSSGDTVLASYLWQRALPTPYPEWLEENFAAPLGITSLVAEADASGVQVGSSYAYMTARDWLRAGVLWLDAWHGRSELLSRDWLHASVQPRDSDPAGRYGRGFWLNTGGVRHEGLPETLFAASGNAGQSVTVIPEWEAVVVRLGLTTASSTTGMNDFLKALDAYRREER